MKKIFVLSSNPEKLSGALEHYAERNFTPEFIATDEHLSFTEGIQKVIKESNDEDYIIISTSQHRFCSSFSQDHLEKCIEKVKRLDGNLLLGGLLGFEKVIEVSDHIFWVDGFKGSQFMIIFKKTYSLFLQRNFNAKLPLDVFLSSHLEDVFVMHPFISQFEDDGNLQSFENTTDFQYIYDNPEVFLDELSQIKKYYSYEP
ncbi:hypothetical protein [Chryseobacterium sp. EZn1]|uniref:hypothetical protein n=1 Tax=Chryseobacterium cupriresistens TaxID=3366770 RepID=UPI0039853B6A